MTKVEAEPWAARLQIEIWRFILNAATLAA